MSFLVGAAGAFAVIWIGDQSLPPLCTPQAQAQVKEQAQAPLSTPALPAPEQRVATVSAPAPAPAPAPVPSVQEPGRTTVATQTLSEVPTVPLVQGPAPTKARPKAPEPAGGYWNSGEFAAGLH